MPFNLLQTLENANTGIISSVVKDAQEFINALNLSSNKIKQTENVAGLNDRVQSRLGLGPAGLVTDVVSAGTMAAGTDAAATVGTDAAATAPSIVSTILKDAQAIALGNTPKTMIARTIATGLGGLGVATLVADAVHHFFPKLSIGGNAAKLLGIGAAGAAVTGAAAALGRSSAARSHMAKLSDYAAGMHAEYEKFYRRGYRL